MWTNQEDGVGRRVALLAVVLGIVALTVTWHRVLLERAPEIDWVVPPPPAREDQENPSQGGDRQEAPTPAQYFAGWDLKNALQEFSRSRISVTCSRCKAVRQYVIDHIERGVTMKCSCGETTKAGSVRDWIDDRQSEIEKFAGY